jgi:hypothetical protein
MSSTASHCAACSSCTPRAGSRFRGVTIQNGSVPQGQPGAGIFVRDGGYALVKYSIIRNNVASYPGAGAAVLNATLFMQFVTLDSNSNRQYPNDCGGGATSGGGGLAIYDGAWAMVQSSTFVNNAACRGGAIVIGGNASSILLENSTISGNYARYRGGGILFQGGNGNHALRFNTIAYNTAGMTTTGTEKRYGGGIGIAGYVGHLTAVGNIIAKNTVTWPQQDTLFSKGNDCHVEWNLSTFPHSEYYNVIGEMGNCANFGSDLWPEIGSEVAPYDPKLGPLQVNGAQTGYQMLTHKPLAGSPVIAAYWAQNCSYNCPPSTDERGYRRLNAASGKGDPGAVEYNGTP